MIITIEENTLTAKQFISLRESVGWSGVERQVEKALKHSIVSIAAKCENKVVGMGRLVGDGALNWYVQDVVVMPQYQGKGIGLKIMNHILKFIELNSLPDTRVTIGLIAAKGKEDFYRKFDFSSCPNDHDGNGMLKRAIIK